MTMPMTTPAPITSNRPAKIKIQAWGFVLISTTLNRSTKGQPGARLMRGPTRYVPGWCVGTPCARLMRGSTLCSADAYTNSVLGWCVGPPGALMMRGSTRGSADAWVHPVLGWCVDSPGARLMRGPTRCCDAQFALDLVQQSPINLICRETIRLMRSED